MLIFSEYKLYWQNLKFLTTHVLKEIFTNAILFQLTMARPAANILDVKPVSALNKNGPLQSIQRIQTHPIKRVSSLLNHYSLVTGSHVTNTCLPSLVDCLIPWERRIYYDNSLAEPYLLIMLPTSFSIVTSLILHSQPPFEASMPYNIICGPTVSNLITMHQIIIILSPKNG